MAHVFPYVSMSLYALAIYLRIENTAVQRVASPWRPVTQKMYHVTQVAIDVTGLAVHQVTKATFPKGYV